MEKLTQLIIICAFAFASAQLVKFIDFCFSDGNVLDWYYLLILRLQDNHPKLFKVLGGCIICFGFWVNLTIFFLVAYYFELPIIYGIIFIGIGQTVLMRHSDI